jgi:hypothetical protein
VLKRISRLSGYLSVEAEPDTLEARKHILICTCAYTSQGKNGDTDDKKVKECRVGVLLMGLYIVVAEHDEKGGKQVKKRSL